MLKVCTGDFYVIVPCPIFPQGHVPIMSLPITLKGLR